MFRQTAGGRLQLLIHGPCDTQQPEHSTTSRGERHSHSRGAGDAVTEGPRAHCQWHLKFSLEPRAGPST